MGGPQRRHGMAHGAVGEHHGSWGAGKCRSTQGRVDGEFSYQERCLRLALPSAGSAVGGRLDRHRADSRRAVAPAERGPARALGASKRHKPREWPRSGVQPQRYAVRLSREKLFFSEIPGLFMGMEQVLTSSHPAQYDGNSDGCKCEGVFGEKHAALVAAKERVGSDACDRVATALAPSNASVRRFQTTVRVTAALTLKCRL